MGSQHSWLVLVQIRTKEIHTGFGNYKKNIDENLHINMIQINCYFSPPWLAKRSDTVSFKNQLGVQEVIYRSTASSEIRCV